VTCDIEVQRPDGTYSQQLKNAVCLKSHVGGPPSSRYRSNQVLGFVGEKKDPRGKWIVRITLQDIVRHVSIPLETSFSLQ
jgi:hypothetical protein